MKEWLIAATEIAVPIIDGLALIIIVAGTIGTFARAIWAMFSSASAGHERRDIWLGQARWLVAGLTFQLAADILETAVTTSWDAVGRLAAIAAIRTFLDYFLERDLGEIRRRQREPGADNSPAPKRGVAAPEEGSIADCSRSPPFLHEAGDELSNLIGLRIEREMTGVENVDFGLRDVAAIRFRLRRIERRVVFAPEDEKPRLPLAQPCLPFRIGVDVGSIS